MSLAGDFKESINKLGLVQDLIQHGLQVTGEAPKNWYLERAAIALGLDVAGLANIPSAAPTGSPESPVCPKSIQSLSRDVP